MKSSRRPDADPDRLSPNAPSEPVSRVQKTELDWQLHVFHASSVALLPAPAEAASDSTEATSDWELGPELYLG